MERLIDHDVFHVDHNVTESMYILKEYGLSAWIEINALVCEDDAKILSCLNRILRVLEETERYEDCIYLRDIIIPMY